MARNKFEQEFGKKLKNREITPSEDSWGKLENRLNASGEKKTEHRFRWGGIAASLAGGLIILSIAFNSDEIWKTEQVADTPSEDIIIDNKQPFIPSEIVSEEKATATEERVAVTEKEAVEKKSERNNQVATVQEKTAKRERIELNVRKKPVLAQKAGVVPLQQERILAMTTVVSEKETMTEAEVDELLRRAAAEISLENSMADNYSTDPGSLLWEVEMELERSFREKVFEVLKESYLKTKTAVANRSF